MQYRFHLSLFTEVLAAFLQQRASSVPPQTLDADHRFVFSLVRVNEAVEDITLLTLSVPTI